MSRCRPAVRSVDDFLRTATRAIRDTLESAAGGRIPFNAKKDQSACASIEVAEDHVAGRVPERREFYSG